MTSRNLRTYSLLASACLVKFKWCTCWIIVFSFNLCCHYREIFGWAPGTSCFNQWWDCHTKSPVCKLVTSKQQVKPSYSDSISWVRNKGFYKSGNRTARNPQKYVSPCPNSFDLLTCCSCFLPDPITMLTFLMNWRSRCWWWRPFVIFHKHDTIAEHMDLVK